MNDQPTFAYLPNQDPTFQTYSDLYHAAGTAAVNDAIAQADQLSGGYGNTYAAPVAHQAAARHAMKLVEVIPSLYKAAYVAYLNEQKDKYHQAELLNEQDNTDYKRSRDTLLDERKTATLEQDQANKERTAALKAEQINWNRTMDLMIYEAGRDDEQAKRTLALLKEQTKVAQSAAELELKAQQAAITQAQHDAALDQRSRALDARISEKGSQ